MWLLLVMIRRLCKVLGVSHVGTSGEGCGKVMKKSGYNREDMIVQLPPGVPRRFGTVDVSYVCRQG